MTDKRQIELFEELAEDPAVMIFEVKPQEPDTSTPWIWKEIQKRVHEIADLIATTPTPRREKVDMYLVDKMEIISSHIDRIITPLKEDDSESKTKA